MIDFFYKYCTLITGLRFITKIYHSKFGGLFKNRMMLSTINFFNLLKHLLIGSLSLSSNIKSTICLFTIADDIDYSCCSYCSFKGNNILSQRYKWTIEDKDGGRSNVQMTSGKTPPSKPAYVPTYNQPMSEIRQQKEQEVLLLV